MTTGDAVVLNRDVETIGQRFSVGTVLIIERFGQNLLWLRRPETPDGAVDLGPIERTAVDEV